MMTKPLQQCNGCKAVNTAGATDWIAIPHVMMGTNRQPIRTFPPTQLDFCPGCAAKTTVALLPALLTAKQTGK